MKGAVNVLRRAEIAKASVRLPSEALNEGSCQPRLADAWFTR
jgi:hypothetical protein